MLLTKLLLAHLIGDFFLQPQKWVKDKEQNAFKSTKLYLHVLIHVSLTALILWDISNVLYSENVDKCCFVTSHEIVQF